MKQENRPIFVPKRKLPYTTRQMPQRRVEWPSTTITENLIIALSRIEKNIKQINHPVLHDSVNLILDPIRTVFPKDYITSKLDPKFDSYVEQAYSTLKDIEWQLNLLGKNNG